MSKLSNDVAPVAAQVYPIESFLWKNELMTWNGDELATEEIFDAFVNAVLEEN